jgi:hypothetical protein
MPVSKVEPCNKYKQFLFGVKYGVWHTMSMDDFLKPPQYLPENIDEKPQ